MIKKAVAFVGAGNMGEALIRGMLDAELVAPSQIRASDRRAKHLGAVGERYGINTYESNVEAVTGADVVLLAIKPQIADEVLDEIREALDEGSLLISIVAGKAIDGIEGRLRPESHVVRTMPNVACLVGEGATALARGRHVSDDELEVARRIFDSVGLSVVLDEEQLDAVTGLSGSGPAYIFMVIDALSDAGVKVGLSRWDAHALACQTVLGAAKLTIETQEHPGYLKDKVCSPGGTAIAAVHALEEGGLRTTLINAVEVATRRAAELGAREE